jgi:hypothetical protein
MGKKTNAFTNLSRLWGRSGVKRSLGASRCHDVPFAFVML